MGLLSLASFSAPARQGVWHGDELGAAESQVLATGHAALDAQLPGGGWPIGAMTELLQDAPEAHVWQLLLPALARAVHSRGGPVALIGAPHEPFGPALAAGGLDTEALLWIRSETSAARLWSCEQALRCADMAAVLAWLPQARVGELRRLQLAAAQHEALLFVFRPESAAQGASPARLRIAVHAAEGGQMDVHILKRRGPPLSAPLTLPARSERMSALLAASQWRRKLRQQALGQAVGEGATVVRLPVPRSLGDSHALDRAALAV